VRRPRDDAAHLLRGQPELTTEDAVDDDHVLGVGPLRHRLSHRTLIPSGDRVVAAANIGLVAGRRKGLTIISRERFSR
jgi:hypothetical protein